MNCKGIERDTVRQTHKKKIENIKDKIGCLVVPLFIIVAPILLFYIGGWFFTETSVGQFLGNIFIYGFLIFLLSCGLLILFGIGCAAYSSAKDSTGSSAIGLLAAVIGIVLFVWIMNSLPKSCDGFDSDHVHYEKFHQ